MKKDMKTYMDLCFRVNFKHENTTKHACFHVHVIFFSVPTLPPPPHYIIMVKGYHIAAVHCGYLEGYLDGLAFPPSL